MESSERELIADALAVHQIAEDVFCPKSLWTPYGHPGAYGGQVMAQAIHATSAYAGSAFALHSFQVWLSVLLAVPYIPSYGISFFQCHFLRATADVNSLRYQVCTMKEGRSFKVFKIKAFQDDKNCMILVSSFQKHEPRRSPSVHWPMPDNVPSPDELDLDGDFYLKQSARAVGEMKRAFLGLAKDRARIPLLLTESIERTTSAGYLTSMRWMRIPGAEDCDLSVQKCILTYMSDFDFLGVAASALGLKRLGRGPGTVKSISTLNHSTHFYSDSLNCSDWVLFVTSAPCAGFGRATVWGKFYSRDGRLLAVAMQEGVLRAYGDEGEFSRKLTGKL